MTREEEDVIRQADALMRRHRCFVARPADAAAAASNAVQEADIPVLTDVVDTKGIVPQDIDTTLAALQEEIDGELSSWLIEVLPAAVANASQQILAELDAKARSTLLPRLRELIEARRSHGD